MEILSILKFENIFEKSNRPNPSLCIVSVSFNWFLFFFLLSGRLPTVHDYRVFILNWEGRRRKRRSLGIVMSGFEEHIQLYLYNKMKNKQCHTVGTVLKSNRKSQKEAKLIPPNTNIWLLTFLAWYEHINKMWKGSTSFMGLHWLYKTLHLCTY